MARRSKPAAELMRELEADPGWVARRDAKEAQIEALRQECAKDQAQMIAEIRDAGFEIESVWDFVNNQPHPVLKRSFTKTYGKAYPILMRHLDVEHHPRVREGIIRSLTVKDGGPELETVLLDQFYSEQEHSLRWVLANALRTAVPYHRRRKHPEIAAILKMDTYITNEGESGRNGD